MLKLEVKNLSRSFGCRHVFSAINFSLEPGHSLAVVGPNGSGKTTLIQTIIGLIKPSGGEALFMEDGRHLQFESYRHKISLVAPYMALYGSLTARENLRFISEVSGFYTSQDEINGALEQVDLGGRGDEPISTYSSGMQQRLKYAAAILKNPDILFLDEPTANLDDAGKKMVFDLIRSVKPDSIVIIATNEKEEYSLAETICQLGE
jgi:heme exporter protein A